MKTMSKSDCNKLNNYIKEKVIEIPVEIDDDNKTTILCKNYLPLENIMDIVEKVVIFATSDGDTYTPEFVDMALGRYLIEYLTNIPLPKDENDDVDFARCYDIYTRLDLLTRMSEADSQLSNLLCDIEFYIDSKLDFVLNSGSSEASAPKKFGIIERAADFISKASEDPEYLNKLVEKATEKYLAIANATASSPISASTFQDNIIQLRKSQNNGNEK